MREVNLSNVQESTEFEKVIPGGYVCIIKTADDVSEKEYLELTYDIAEGSLKGHYADEFLVTKHMLTDFSAHTRKAHCHFLKRLSPLWKNQTEAISGTMTREHLPIKLLGLSLLKKNITAATALLKSVCMLRSVQVLTKSEKVISRFQN